MASARRRVMLRNHTTTNAGPLAVGRFTAPRWLGFISFAAASVIALSFNPSLVNAQFTERPLNAEERGLLSRGEHVQHRRSERRGNLRLIGGTSYQVIDAPSAAVWRAVNDEPGRLKHMLPQVRRSYTVAQDGTSKTMMFEHAVGVVRVRYALRFDYDPANRVVLFRLDEQRPHDIRAAWGFFRLRDFGSARTLVTFGTMVDVGSGIITGLVRDTVHEWILRIPWTMKRYIEGRGRRHYL